MAITKQWLRRAANEKSYSRGEEYYDEVSDIVRRGNAYTATVCGSDDYEVSITDNAQADPSAYCDCPYDYDGICKHIVAVGLNIIDGRFEEEEVEEIPTTPTDAAYLALSATSFYDSYFLKKEEAVRTVFLRQLFANDEKLRRQFYEFSKPKLTIANTPIITEGGVLIEKTTARLSKKLEKISTLEPDDFYGRAGYNDYYDDEGDAYQEWIDGKIEEVFSPFQQEAQAYIQNGAIQAATEFFIGLYEGCLGLEFDSDTSDYMGDDFESVALGKLESLILEQKEAIEKAIFHENDIKASILLILNRWAKRKNVVETVDFFEHYLIALSNQPATAQWLIKEIEARNWSLTLIYLTLANAETLQDDTLWLSSAEKVAYENPSIMQLLLDKYLSLSLLAKFHKAANAAFTDFKDSNFVPYLKTHVLEKYDTNLYIQVHLKSASTKNNLADFLTVRHLLAAYQEADFIQNCKKDNQNLYVELLNHDGKLADILAFIKEKSSPSHPYYFYSWGFDMDKALSFVIEKYPDEVFKIVNEQASKGFDTMKMDRNGYAQACARLKPLKGLPESHKAQFKVLLHNLRERFKNRPAFLDELSRI